MRWLLFHAGSLLVEALKLVERRFDVSAQLPYQLQNGLVSGSKHVIVHRTDTFQDLVCSKSQSHIAVIAGAGAAVV